MIYQFNNIFVDTERYQLEADGNPIPTEPQVFDLLLYLIENRGRVVSRDELLENLWKGKVVSDAALNGRLKALRKAIGDSGNTQNVIKTIHGRGYEFVAALGDSNTAQQKEALQKLELPDQPSIAVLPFTNLSGDPEQRYFSDGIAEDIITELSRFSTLFVIGRNSSFRYRDDDTDLERIGDELGIQYVLQGSVRKGGDKIRINVQLIDVSDGHHLWGSRYDRVLDDVFTVQDEIVDVVVSTVASQVTASELERRKTRSTTNFTAYDHYLRAQGTLDYDPLGKNEFSWNTAREHFERAIELDPEYVDALAELSMAYMVISYYAFGEAIDENMRLAQKYAERALVLDPNHARAHSSVGNVQLDLGKHERAERHVNQAFALNPNDSTILGHRSMMLANIGKFEEAIECAQSAIRRDPYCPEWVVDCLGEAYFLARQYENAISTYERLNSTPFWVHGQLAACCACIGDEEKARYHAQMMRDAAPEGREIQNEIEWAQIRIKHQVDKEHYLEAYRRAGLIE